MSRGMPPREISMRDRSDATGPRDLDDFHHAGSTRFAPMTSCVPGPATKSTPVRVCLGVSTLGLVLAFVVWAAVGQRSHNHHDPEDDIVPGAGYRSGGWDTCGACAVDGENNVNLLARVCEYPVPGAVDADGLPVRIVIRTFVDGSGDGGCGEGGSMMGPTLEIKPGDRLNILVRNNISQDGWFADGPLGPRPPQPADYLYYAQDWGRYAGMTNCSVGPLRMYGTAPPCGPHSNRSSEKHSEQCTDNGQDNAGFRHVDWDNIPGSQSGGFDAVNLHLHGLEIMPHMFHPQGSAKADAAYVRILPPSHDDHDSRGCYCYKFKIPEDHPQGMYWYHIHAHGTIAVQVWSGMAGMLHVHREGEGQEAELIGYGAERELHLPIVDPHIEVRLAPATEGAHLRAGGEKVASPRLHAIASTFGVSDFLRDQTDQSEVRFLGGGEARPRLTAGAPYEPVRLRILCATAENLASVEVVDNTTGETLSDVMWHVASDGIGFDRPYAKDFLVMAGGQREEVVLSLPRAGFFQLAMKRCNFIQFFCTGSEDTILAYVQVLDEPPKPPETPIAEWRFKPGKALDEITEADVRARRYWTFDVMAQREMIPFPKFMVNGNSYDMNRVDEEVRVGDAEEWILSNPDNTWHPFHIHVAPFLVLETKCNWPYAKNFTDVMGQPQPPTGLDVHAFVESSPPVRRWRDTVLLPPFSTTRILAKFPRRDFVGKTVAHCHFEAHDDTGMAAIVMLKPAREEGVALSPPAPRVTVTRLGDAEEV